MLQEAIDSILKQPIEKEDIKEKYLNQLFNI